MKFAIRHLIFSALLLLAFAGRASAQYIWMDSNGDGVHTAADVMSPNGTPTTVDFWLNTNHNKDGSLAICDTGDGNLDTWNSYAIHVSVLNGTATFANYVNQQSTFVTGCADAGNVFFKTDNATIMSACAATGTQTPNG
ncbi:MAG: hypothetical protein ACM3PF_00790, partial [Bacteroidota bacterium]